MVEEKPLESGLFKVERVGQLFLPHSWMLGRVVGVDEGCLGNFSTTSEDGERSAPQYQPISIRAQRRILTLRARIPQHLKRYMMELRYTVFLRSVQHTSDPSCGWINSKFGTDMSLRKPWTRPSHAQRRQPTVMAKVTASHATTLSRALELQICPSPAQHNKTHLIHKVCGLTVDAALSLIRAAL